MELTLLRFGKLRRAGWRVVWRFFAKFRAGLIPIRAAAHFKVMNNEYKFRYLIIASLFIMLFSACSRTSVIIENFKAKSGELLLLPVKHTSFLYPQDECFQFEEFYERLNDKGYVIYPGKVSDADCFRIGNIGRIFESDVRALLAAIQETLTEMNVKLDEAAC